MKLLFLLPSYSRGGAEELPLRLARYAVDIDIDVHAVLSDTPGNRTIARDLATLGVHVYHASIQDEGRRKILLNLRQLFNTVRMLLRIRPDVVQINVPYPRRSPGAMLACALLGRPALVLFHLIPEPIHFSPAARRIYAWIRSRSQQWIAVSESNRRLLLDSFDAPKDEIFRIYNGYTPPEDTLCMSEKQRTEIRAALRYELALDADAQLLLTVGRLSHQKGYDLILKVARQVVDRFSDAHFVWVGDGELAEDLKAAALHQGLADHIHFLYHRQDVPGLMRASDLFVFPTRFEGQPLALMEALAHGMPVVASTASGIPEVITSGTHGLLVPVDDTTALRDALLWALEHPDQMHAMGRRAQERARDFSEEEMMEQYRVAWRRLGRKAGRRDAGREGSREGGR